MNWLGAALMFLAGSVLGQGFDHTHNAWDALVKKQVVVVAGGNASQVRYTEFAKDRAALKNYLDSLSGVTEADFKSWARPQQMAFLINAYNAFTVELILAHFPVKSIKDIGSDLFNNRWKKKFFRLLGQDAYLDQIEHEILRKPGNYNEPRVHFAVNCASIGCPMLREEAYVAERLDAQLEEQAVRFLSDRSRNRVSAQGQLEVSKIFDWFKEDWSSGYQGIQSREKYFAKYAKLLSDNPDHQKLVAEGRAPISFLDYDWTLNDARK
ncbi:MAG: DUF547 domain-containing protein [Pseudomonadota bacterium]